MHSELRINGLAYMNGKTHALTLSYDDAREDERRLMDILNKHGVRGTFHINTSRLGRPTYIEENEVAPLYKGHEIAAHTVDHPFLTHLPAEQIVSEIVEDRRKLESIAGVPVRGFSYPFGVFNPYIKSLLPACGVDYARTINSHKEFRLPDDFFEWNPTCHHNDATPERCDAFLAARPGSLFYVWGHAHEFPRNNNWHIIEAFCLKMGGRDNIWYATNGELFDYLKALRRLQYNVSRTQVKNPSAVSVWIRVEGKIVELPAGRITTLS